MTYREAVRHLNARQMFGIKLGLTNIRKLLKRLGNPERSFESIHIAGTNGKGSTAAMLASILTAQGFTTGLYTSPHISSVRERIKVNDELIQPGEFAGLFEMMYPYLDEIPCTYFECTTALTFLYFRQRNVEKAVIEVGLGGRFDATNVVMPVCSVITTIDYDHQQHLGDSLEKIAGEKSGIIKKGIPVVSGVSQPTCRRVIASAAALKNAPVHEAGKTVVLSHIQYFKDRSSFTATIGGITIPDFIVSLSGTFQVANAQTAIAAFSVIYNGDIESAVPYIRSGLASVSFPERFMLYRRNPDVIIDVAHNRAGFCTLAENIRKLFPNCKVLLVVGLKEDKDCASVLEPFLSLCRAGIGIPIRCFSRKGSNEKGVSGVILRSVFKQRNIPFRHFRSVHAGVRYAFDSAGKKDVILCAGSHYTVHALKKAIKLLD